MTLREFFKKYDIVGTDFARACEIPAGTMNTYIGRHRTPNLRNAVKIILQSRGMVTMVDLLRKDQPLMREDQPTMPWKPRRVLTRKKKYIPRGKRRAHYRKVYYNVVDDL